MLGAAQESPNIVLVCAVRLLLVAQDTLDLCDGVLSVLLVSRTNGLVGTDS